MRFLVQHHFVLRTSVASVHNTTFRRMTTSLAVKRAMIRSTTVTGARYFARVSSIQGTIDPPKDGFVTEDVKIDMNANLGGAYARGVFARREIGYGREIMNIPAFVMYIGDNNEQALRDQVMILTKEVFTRLVLGSPEERKYIKHRVVTLMSGGFSYFTREKDVFEFAEEVRAPGPEGALKNGANFLLSGEFSSYDLQKLPLIIEFNRYDVEYNGRRGICLFPEAQYFNHQCDPNVEVTITYNSVKGVFFLSARTVRPVREGEELFINYMPGNTLPISRLALAMKKRWGFECTCVKCKSRGIGAVTMLFVVVMVPMTAYLRSINVRRTQEKQRGI
ncbi:SET domain [Trypanosoma melophagium]|uniref:SET domain n=1 Tax=Trypanosoma melophagium TaxID=715481 RepID=UPI00351A6F36|nr:SET domain [Trypanosoma melophagium]